MFTPFDALKSALPTFGVVVKQVSLSDDEEMPNRVWLMAGVAGGLHKIRYRTKFCKTCLGHETQREVTL